MITKKISQREGLLTPLHSKHLPGYGKLRRFPMLSPAHLGPRWQVHYEYRPSAGKSQAAKRNYFFQKVSLNRFQRLLYAGMEV